MLIRHARALAEPLEAECDVRGRIAVHSKQLAHGESCFLTSFEPKKLCLWCGTGLCKQGVCTWLYLIFCAMPAFFNRFELQRILGQPAGAGLRREQGFSRCGSIIQKSDFQISSGE